MGPVVNSEVSIDDIKMDDLKKIFTGEITNWKEVGGQDRHHRHQSRFWLWYPCGV